jgi:hypothetical protein
MTQKNIRAASFEVYALMLPSYEKTNNCLTDNHLRL